MTKLQAILELLRPALRGLAAEARKECDLIADHTTGSIDLLINEPRREPLFSAEEIADNSYKEKFTPRVRELLSENDAKRPMYYR